MPRIFAIGETVLDIIFENDKPVSACVGGSMLNSSISLGRMRAPVSLITGYSRDKVGDMADSFLRQNSVDISFVRHYDDGKTAVALAFLDEDKKATYQFYQDRPANEHELKLPEFIPGDLLLFGSFFSLMPVMRPYFTQLLELAKNAGICTIYDPNFRAAHINDLQFLKPAILSNMSYASIIRGSDEDFEHIFGMSDPDAVYSIVKAMCQNLIITRGPNELLLFTSQFKKLYSVPRVSVVSTIGAGDSFNAGILKGLSQIETNNNSSLNLNEQTWDTLISYGIACASAVCASSENYVPDNFIPSKKHNPIAGKTIN
jgi:fructokinase